LDVTDSCWLDAFGKEERHKIRGFRCVDIIPDLSLEVDTYLKQLEDFDASESHARVDSGDFRMESDSKWIRKGSVVKRVWSCVDTCFDFCTIKKCVR